MGESAQDEFPSLRAAAAGGQGRAKPALVLAKSALRVPVLVAKTAWEVLVQRAIVRGLELPIAAVERVDQDHGSAQAELFAAEAVVLASIGQRHVECDGRRGLPHGRGGVERVLARPNPRHRARGRGA